MGDSETLGISRVSLDPKNRLKPRGTGSHRYRNRLSCFFICTDPVSLLHAEGHSSRSTQPAHCGSGESSLSSLMELDPFKGSRKEGTW